MTLKALPPDLSRPRDGVEPYDDNWKAWVKEIEDYLGYKVCGRRTARKTPCPKRPITGRVGCARHGGKTLRGPAHPNWKDGRASLYAELMPAEVMEKYERLISDPKLLALDNDIALMEIRQLELYRDFQGNLNPGDSLKKIIEEVKNLRVAVAEGNIVNIGLSAEEIASVAASGNDATKAWEGFVETTERKRRLVESEGRRLERMRVTLTAEEARMRDRMLIAILLRAVQQLTDPAEARAVLRDVVEGVGKLGGGSPQLMLDPAKEIRND